MQSVGILILLGLLQNLQFHGFLRLLLKIVVYLLFDIADFGLLDPLRTEVLHLANLVLQQIQILIIIVPFLYIPVFPVLVEFGLDLLLGVGPLDVLRLWLVALLRLLLVLALHQRLGHLLCRLIQVLVERAEVVQVVTILRARPLHQLTTLLLLLLNHHKLLRV